MKTSPHHAPNRPSAALRALRLSIASEASGKLNVEGVEVDVADALEQLGGPRVGQGLGELIAPGLILGLQGAELVDSGRPPLRPRPAVFGTLWRRSNGLAGGAARPVSALALGVAQGHRHQLYPLPRNGPTLIRGEAGVVGRCRVSAPPAAVDQAGGLVGGPLFRRQGG